MMDRDSLPFKIGDQVWFRTTESATRCTVLGLNPAKGAVWTASVRADDGREFVCSINQLSAGLEPPPLIPRYPPGFPPDEWRRACMQPVKLEPEPELLCTSAEATEANLAEVISLWECIVSYFEKFPNDDSEYDHDLMRREEVHRVVNGFKQAGLAIPVMLQERLDAADKRFMLVTQPDKGVWHDSERYDKTVFWYYFRWLKPEADNK